MPHKAADPEIIKVLLKQEIIRLGIQNNPQPYRLSRSLSSWRGAFAKQCYADHQNVLERFDA